jgi:peptidoglycan/LPS O-acetylase OafA/YrhL
MTTGPAPTRYFNLPSLDGVRALAALIVFVSHAGLGHMLPGGFGVTVFFFLSGYLITTLMRREFEQTGSVDFKAFYLRRVYRILPPLYVSLAVIAGIYAVIGFDGPVSPAYVLSLLLQYSNYYLLQVGVTDLLPATGSYWSLAVEEHFYLVFPLVFLLASRRWSMSGVARLLLGLCLLVLAWRYVLILGFGMPAERTYLGTDTRVDSMLWGCIMGVWMNPALDRDPFSGNRAKVAWLVAGLALLGAAFVIRDPLFRTTLRYTVQGFALFPLFWLAVRHPEWPIFRVLNTAPARLIGAISYTFYLSHLLWLGLVAKYLGGPPVATALVALVLTLLFSYAVYRLVELPFARLRQRMHAKPGKAAAQAAGKDARTA